MRQRTALVAMLLCALSGSRSAAAWTRDRVLVVLEDRSGNEGATRDVTAAIAELLKQKRYDVVGAESQASVPVDRSGGAAAPAIRAAAQKAGVQAVLTVSIGFQLDAHERPRGPGAKPAIGMLARLYSPDARVLWRNSLAMILDEPTRQPGMKTAYVSRSRRLAAAPNAEATYKSPTTIVCEQLLWTLPRGRPSPEELAARTAPPPAVMLEPAKATRFENAPQRARPIGSAARFPLRLDRTREKHERGAPVAPTP